jgi:hypothetical protein
MRQALPSRSFGNIVSSTREISLNANVSDDPPESRKC